MTDEVCDVVVLGAGVSGMTAAYELRDRNVIVLEGRSRVGGRTYSGGDDAAWYNLGAQLVSNERLVALVEELGLEVVSVASADFAFIVDGVFARGKSPERLVLNLNLPWLKKLDFGVASLRLRRQLNAVGRMSAGERAGLDRVSLQDVIGRVSPTSFRMLSDCCENAVGIPAMDASGLFGLAYGLGAFLDPASKEHLYSVRGGTQKICSAIAEALPAESVRVSCTVGRVRQNAARVDVSYTSGDGQARTLRAKQCVCALPATAVLDALDDLSGQRKRALQHVAPYSSLISAVWPVADGRAAPWDGVFVCPATGDMGFNLLTNYGFLAKQTRPDLGGYLNTLSAGAKAELFEVVDDEALLDRLYEDLTSVFPEAGSLIDRTGAVVQRWERGGLPRMRPRFLEVREELRRSVDGIHFCGDYTSEPGLPGANGSGMHAARSASQGLVAA